MCEYWGDYEVYVGVGRLPSELFGGRWVFWGPAARVMYWLCPAFLAEVLRCGRLGVNPVWIVHELNFQSGA